VAAGHDTAYVIGQLRHTDPAVTYGKYAKAIRPEDRQRLRTLVKGIGPAVAGSSDAESSDNGEVTVSRRAAGLAL
jgi:hypothetical protein